MAGTTGRIRDAEDDKFMELRYPGGEEYLRPGQAYGDVDALAALFDLYKRITDDRGFGEVLKNLLFDFYVRSGPGTVKLAPASAKEYIRTRFAGA